MTPFTSVYFIGNITWSNKHPTRDIIYGIPCFRRNPRVRVFHLPLMGQCLLQVQCQGRSAKLFAVVSKGNRQNLLGRTWIDALKLDIYHMNQVQNSQSALDSLLRCYSSIFQDGLGHCNKLKVHLTLKALDSLLRCYSGWTGSL